MNSVHRVVAVVGLVALLAACQRQATLGPPGSDVRFRQAEAALRAGELTRADDLYESLSEGSTGPLRELALSRRALIYALPGTSIHSPEQSEALLDQLLSEFPDTTMRTETEALLGVVPDIVDLQESAARSLDELGELRAAIDTMGLEREQLRLFLAYVSPFSSEFDLDRARAEYRNLIGAYPDDLSRRIAEQMLFLVSQWERLDALGARPETTLEELRREVAALSDELETLKEIDLGRRLPD